MYLMGKTTEKKNNKNTINKQNLVLLPYLEQGKNIKVKSSLVNEGSKDNLHK